MKSEFQQRSIMIEAENLTKKFGSLTAVDEVSLHVDEGLR